MATQVYGAWRNLVKKMGGEMKYERKGRPQWGAWVIRIGSRSKVIPSEGKASFPDLDQCYEPKILNPKTYYDYHGESTFKQDCAEMRLRAWGLIAK